MLEVKLLGQYEVRRDGTPLVIPSRGAQSLLAFLLLNPGVSHRREKLAGLLWPDTTEDHARRRLRQELWRLRQAVESDPVPGRSKAYLLADDLSIAFNADLPHWLDVSVLASGDAGASANELVRAVTVYEGELLPGFYDEWIVVERERLRALFEQKMARLLDRLVQDQRWDDVLEWGERWIHWGRSPEPAFRALMTAYAALGDRSQVAAVFERCLQALREDLNVEPSPQTRTLFQRLSTENSLPHADEGSSFSSPRARLTNLPISLTSFIGRERETDEVRRLLSATRLLTLTGSGGCGKTRLALQVAAGLREQFPDGVWLVDLAPVSNSALVPQTVASIFDLHESGETPLPQILQTYFQTKQTLWVLDNCEHMIQACAELCHTLLRACPDLKILATSREALNIAGETTFRVPSLALPDLQRLPPLQTLGECESIHLFTARARAARSDLELTDSNARLVAQICERLDGMPLAIELAAARANAFSVGEIAARLDDRFRLLTSGSRATLPRYQTLRASIDWSYDLLSEAERVLLQRLAVFAGGFTLEAVETVCGDQFEDKTVDLLSRLLLKSLVIGKLDDQPRYRLLETIRQYAIERLVESGGGDAVKDRHLDYFVSFAQAVAPRLHGPEEVRALDLLDRETDNLRAALEWSLHEGRVEKGLCLAGALMWFWDRRGYFREGLGRLEGLLKQPEAGAGTLARAQALVAVGHLTNSLAAVWLGGSKASRPYLEEAVTIAREQGPAGKHLCALALTLLSNSVYGEDHDLGQLQYDEAWAIAHEVNDPWIGALLVHQRAHWYESQKDYPAADRGFEESLNLFRSLGDRHWAAILQNDIAGHTYFRQGNYAGARRLLEENLSYFREIRDRMYFCFALGTLSWIARCEDHYDVAKQYDLEELTIARELGSKLLILGTVVNLGFCSVHDGELDSARPLLAEGLALAQELESKDVAAEAVCGFALLAAAGKQARRSVQLFAAADALSGGQTRADLPPLDQAERERSLTLAREQLGQAAFDAAWDKGCAMTIEQAVEYALAEPDREPEVQVLQVPSDKPGPLTAREREVAVLIAQGKSNPEIAKALVVSERTVTTHVSHIFAKLGLTSRTQVAAWAAEHRLRPSETKP